MSHRSFNYTVVFAMAVLFGFAMANLSLPAPLTFALGLPFGAVTWTVADKWWRAHH